MKLSPYTRRLVWGTEDWVVSAMPGGSSVIADGPSAGRPLAEVKPGLPLLFKVIDTHSRLSVQVHPCEETVALTGGAPKTEMWCILKPGPIYAGLKPGTTKAEVEAAVKSGDFERILVRHDAKAFETYFIPAGLVHAIGEGVKLYEVQQSSDTTFRLYDWGRMGADGRPRELHVDKSMQAMKIDLPPPKPGDSVSCPYFRFSQRVVDYPAEIVANGESRLAVYALESGESFLLEPGEKTTVPPGRLFITEF